MYLLVIEDDADAPVELVAQARRAVGPNALDLLAPAGLQLLIEVEANADVDVLGDQRQCRISGQIKAPRVNIDVTHVSARFTQGLDRAVGAAGVSDED